MVSSVVEELVVAETPQDVADSGDADLQLLPSGASKPLIGTSPNVIVCPHDRSEDL